MAKKQTDKQKTLDRALATLGDEVRDQPKGHPACSEAIRILQTGLDSGMGLELYQQATKARNLLRAKVDRTYPAIADNVASYFVQRLGPTHGTRDIVLISIPLDSPCGVSCKDAIDAGCALMAHVEAATGQLDYPERNEALRQVVMHVVMTYCCG